jgi:hypothetical protein
MSYRVVQPYGSRPEEWTLISEHSTALDAFSAIDARAPDGSECASDHQRTNTSLDADGYR